MCPARDPLRSCLIPRIPGVEHHLPQSRCSTQSSAHACQHTQKRLQRCSSLRAQSAHKTQKAPHQEPAPHTATTAAQTAAAAPFPLGQLQTLSCHQRDWPPHPMRLQSHEPVAATPCLSQCSRTLHTRSPGSVRSYADPHRHSKLASYPHTQEQQLRMQSRRQYHWRMAQHMQSGKASDSCESRAMPAGITPPQAAQHHSLHKTAALCAQRVLCNARRRGVHCGAHLLVTIEHADLAVGVHVDDHAVALLHARHKWLSQP